MNCFYGIISVRLPGNNSLIHLGENLFEFYESWLVFELALKAANTLRIV